MWPILKSSVAPQSHGFDCVAGTLTGLTADLSLCTRLRKRWSQGPFSVVRKVQGLFLFHVDGTYNWIRNVFSWSFLYSLNCKVLWKYDPSIIFKGKEFLFFSSRFYLTDCADCHKVFFSTKTNIHDRSHPSVLWDLCTLKGPILGWGSKFNSNWVYVDLTQGRRSGGLHLCLPCFVEYLPFPDTPHCHHP